MSTSTFAQGFTLKITRKNGLDNELRSGVYNGQRLINSVAFYRWLQTKTSEMLYGVPKNVFDQVATIAYELFANAHDHGRHEAEGNTIKENVRSMKIGKATHKGKASIEIEVSDLGAGLASIMLGKPIEYVDPADEINATIKCFDRHATSTQKGSRGSGLTKVLFAIHQCDGTLHVRTGHAIIYKDFSTEPALEVTTSHARMVDEITNGTKFVVTLPIGE